MFNVLVLLIMSVTVMLATYVLYNERQLNNVIFTGCSLLLEYLKDANKCASIDVMHLSFCRDGVSFFLLKPPFKTWIRSVPDSSINKKIKKKSEMSVPDYITHCLFTVKNNIDI
jgi:hypothetical protein